MVISKICTNCRSEILGEFLGVNVPFPAREGGCPPPVTVCEKASLQYGPKIQEGEVLGGATAVHLRQLLSTISGGCVPPCPSRPPHMHP